MSRLLSIIASCENRINLLKNDLKVEETILNYMKQIQADLAADELRAKNECAQCGEVHCRC